MNISLDKRHRKIHRNTYTCTFIKKPRVYDYANKKKSPALHMSTPFSVILRIKKTRNIFQGFHLHN